MNAKAVSAEGPAVPLLGVVLVSEDFDAQTPIGGLPPLLRHALALQAAGAGAVVVLGTAAPVPAVKRLTIPVLHELPAHECALVVRADVTAHRSLPARLAALPVNVQEAVFVGEAQACLVLCGGQRTEGVVSALFDRALPTPARGEALAGEGLFAEFVVPAASVQERKAATKKHLQSLRKPTGGVFENLYMRPLSMHMTAALCRTPITPNAMSIVTLAVALSAGALVALPEAHYSVAGGLLHVFMRVVDCIDGELARLRYQSSRFGEWLDTIGDGIGMAAFLGGVTLHAMRHDPQLAVIGVVGIAAWLLVQGLQIAGAMRVGETGTFHRVQWGHRQQERSLVERLVGKLEMVFRIDAISTYYGIAVALGAHRPLLFAHAAVALVASFYFGTQVLKLRTR
jgi:phosphatidylglycerophosphate synthase